MSSKKFVSLFMVLAVFGVIAGSAAYGQSTISFTIEGTVMEADGTPAPGLRVAADAALFPLLRVPTAHTVSPFLTHSGAERWQSAIRFRSL